MLRTYKYEASGLLNKFYLRLKTVAIIFAAKLSIHVVFRKCESTIKSHKFFTH